MGYHYYNYYYSTYGWARVAYLIYRLIKRKQSSQKPPKSDIKKYLKIVVDFSNIIQDENNKLQDMKDAWEPFEKIFSQRLYIGKLCVKRQQAIKDLQYIESFYPEEIKNRFFYFRDKPIYFP